MHGHVLNLVFQGLLTNVRFISISLCLVIVLCGRGYSDTLTYYWTWSSEYQCLNDCFISYYFALFDFCVVWQGILRHTDYWTRPSECQCQQSDFSVQRRQLEQCVLQMGGGAVGQVGVRHAIWKGGQCMTHCYDATIYMNPSDLSGWA